MRDPARWSTLLAAIWLGLLLAVAVIAAPAAFAVLPSAEAGKLVGRIFAREATASIVFGVALVLLTRTLARGAAAASGVTLFSLELILVLAAVACTVVGHYALLPLIDAARAGTGRLTFGQLHAISVVVFGLKTLLVAALAWRLLGTLSRAPTTSSSG